MEIQFHGANCISLNTKKSHFVLDDNLASLGLKTVVDTSATAAIYSQQRLKPENLPKGLFVIDGPGEYEVSKVSFMGIPARAQTDEPNRHTAVVYRIAVAGIMIAFLGHIYPELSEEQLEKIGMVDVVVLPVGGNGYTLDAHGAAKLVKQIEPKIIIPTHYDERGVKYEVPQSSLEDFSKEFSVNPEPVEKLKLKAGTIPDTLAMYKLQRN